MQPHSPAASGALHFSHTAPARVVSDFHITADRQLLPPRSYVLAGRSSVPDRFNSIVQAVGLLNNGCTATHVGNRRVLTAGHCFSDAPASCEQARVYWGFLKDQDPVLTSRCVRVLGRAVDWDKDVAVFEVDQAPQHAVQLELHHRPAPGTELTMFGHPKGEPLTWGGFCRLDVNERRAPLRHVMFYRCDSQYGSSGSLLIEVESLRAVGIHRGAALPWRYGTYLVDTGLPTLLQGR